MVCCRQRFRGLAEIWERVLSPSTNTQVLGKGTVSKYWISERLRDWLCGESLMTLTILTFLCDCDLSEAPFGIAQDSLYLKLLRGLPEIQRVVIMTVYQESSHGDCP